MVFAVQGITKSDGSFFIPVFRKQGAAVDVDNFFGIRNTNMAKKFLYPSNPNSEYVGMAVISSQTHGQVEQSGKEATVEQVNEMFAEFVARNPTYGRSGSAVLQDMSKFTPLKRGTIPPRDSAGMTMNQKESDLIERYRDYLGQEIWVGTVSHEGSKSILRFDAYIKESKTLIEAKSVASRKYVREAIGQLLDYARGIEHYTKMILLPSAPEPDLFELCESLAIRICYETDDGFTIGTSSLPTVD